MYLYLIVFKGRMAGYAGVFKLQIRKSGRQNAFHLSDFHSKTQAKKSFLLIMCHINYK